MGILKKLFLIIVLFISFIIIKFRSVPTGHIWDEYTVLYVSDEVEDSRITSVLDDLEIKNYVSKEQQKMPVVISVNSPEESMYKLTKDKSENEYLKKRLNFFYDYSKQYRLYYVPNEFKDKLNSCISILEQDGIYAGVDSSLSFPWILPVLGFIVAAVLYLCSKNKFIFTCASIVPLIYIFCNPFYSCAVAAFLFMLFVFLLSNIWRREGFIKIIFTNYKYDAILGISLISAFSTSFLTGLMFVLTIIASFIILYYLKSREDFEESKYTYKYLMIRTADKINVYAHKAKVVLPTIILCIITIFVYFTLYSSDNIRGHFAKILLPGSSVVKSDAFPELSDYYRWNFDIVTAPMRSLNKSEDKNKVVYPRFVRENGLIKKVENTITFDEIYKTTVYNSIDNLDFESIEKVIKKQGNDFKCGYTSASNFHVSVFSIICMILCLMLLLFLYISVRIKKGSKK